MTGQLGTMYIGDSCVDDSRDNADGDLSVHSHSMAPAFCSPSTTSPCRCCSTTHSTTTSDGRSTSASRSTTAAYARCSSAFHVGCSSPVRLVRVCTRATSRQRHVRFRSGDRHRGTEQYDSDYRQRDAAHQHLSYRGADQRPAGKLVVGGRLRRARRARWNVWQRHASATACSQSDTSTGAKHHPSVLLLPVVAVLRRIRRPRPTELPVPGGDRSRSWRVPGVSAEAPGRDTCRRSRASRWHGRRKPRNRDA